MPSSFLSLSVRRATALVAFTTCFTLAVGVTPSIAATSTGSSSKPTPATTKPVTPIQPRTEAPGPTVTYGKVDNTKLLDTSTRAAQPGPGDAPDVATAESWAKQLKHHVRVSDLLTPTTEIFVEPDGKRTAHIARTPVRFKSAGEWHEINTQLQAGSTVRPTSVAVPMHFAAKGSQPLLALGADGTTFELTSKLGNAAPTLDGATATYDHALSPTQGVTLQSLANGAELSVVLDKAPTSAEWRFPLALTGLTPSGEDGRALVNDKGVVLLQVSAGTVYDSASTNALETGRHESPLRTQIVQGAHGLELVMTASADFLNDPKTVYPVTVDPTITPTEDYDAWINAGLATNTNSQTVLKVGYDSTYSSSDRSLIYFQTGGIASYGVTVNSASANLYQYGSTSCAAKTINLYAVTSGWTASGVLWSNKPTTSGTVTASNSDAFCAGWSSWGGTGMTSLVQGWLNNPATNLGVAFQASNEADTASMRGFLSAQYTTNSGFTPYLSVTYTPVNPVVTLLSKTPVTGDIQSGTNAYTVGQELKYTFNINNPSTTSATMTVSSNVQSVVSGSPLVDGAACTGGVICQVSTAGDATISNLSVPGSSSRTVSFVSALKMPSGRICGDVSTIVSATTAGAGLGSLTDLTKTCGAGLGKEAWWTYQGQTSVGPQGTAEVNTSDGNLVVTQTDDTVIPARGRLAYVLRRTYNSEDTSTGLTLPGGIGAGWVLNTGELTGTDGLTGSDALTAAGLLIPPATSILSPGAIQLIDRDGTRHTFAAKSSTNPMYGTPVATFVSGAFAAASGVGPLAPQALTAIQDNGTNRLALNGSIFPTICATSGYQAPPGVHLSLWRYIATTSANCFSLTDANSMPIGYAAIRPDRMRTEYAWDGKLLDIQDGSGAEMRYAYGGGLPNLPTTLPSPTLPTISALSAVYEPIGCNKVSVDQTTGRIRITDYKICRKAEFSYSFDPGGACPLFDGMDQAVCVSDGANRVTKYGIKNDALSVPRLLEVVNPDASVLHYTYATSGVPCGSSTVGQLCSVTDPVGGTTSFEYAAAPAWASGGPAWVSKLKDRRYNMGGNAGAPTTFAYPSSTETTTTQSNRVYDDKSIDSTGEVGEEILLDGGTSTSLNDTLFTWDATTSCTEPLTNAPNPNDHNICQITRKQLNSMGAPDNVESFRYNPDGFPLVDTKNPASGVTVTTTNGYSTQYADYTGTRQVFTDTLGGSGVVTHGGGTRPGADTTQYTIDDRVASLRPLGNSGTAATYLTTYVVDNLTASNPNTLTTTNCNANGTATGNSGLVCEVDAPSPLNDGTVAKTRYTYNINGSRISMTTPRGVVGNTCNGNSSYTYTYYQPGDTDLTGLLSSYDWLKGVTDPCGNFVAYGYDRAGNIARTWDRDATKAAGRPLADYPNTLAPHNNTPKDQPVTTGPPSLAYTETLYNINGDDDNTDINNPLYPNVSNALMSPWRYRVVTRDAVGAITNDCRDLNGNVTIHRSGRAGTIAPGTCSTATAYDTVSTYAADDEALSVKTPAESTATSFAYDVYGQRTATTRPNNLVTVTKYDAAGRVVGTRWTRGTADNDYNVTNPANADAACGSTPATLTTATDAPLPTGRILCSTTISYDGHNNVIDQYDAAGGHVAHGYDALDRPTSTTVYRDGSTPLTNKVVYDRDSNVTEQCSARDIAEGLATSCGPNSAYAVSHTYSGADLPVSSLFYRVGQGTANGTSPPVTSFTTGQSYDRDGNVVSLTDANRHAGVKTTFYDLLERPASMALQRDATHTYTTTYTYSASGDRLSVTAPAPAGSPRITAYSYDADHRVVDTVQGASSTTASAAGVATGAANIRTRNVYDAEGDVVARFTPNAFAGSVSIPDARYQKKTNYDADGRPTATFTPRSGGALTDPTNLTNSDCGKSSALSPAPSAIYASGQTAAADYPNDTTRA